jgi:hypothetical protein
MADLCFLAEWYRPEPGNELLPETVVRLDECAAAMSEEGSPIQLLTMFAVPPDEMVFALFAAGSAEVVARTCGRAGLPPERLTLAADSFYRVARRCGRHQRDEGHLAQT